MMRNLPLKIFEKFIKTSNLFCCKQISLLSLLLFCVSINSYAQKKISGTVTDETKMGLPGVTVLIKGSTIGSATDLDGKYTLAGVRKNDTLVFTSVGMKTEEIAVGGRTTINISLETDAVSLGEVVAIGYVTRKEGEITGSVSTVGTEELRNTSNKDLAKSLSGKVTGVIISDRGGYPGSTSGDDMQILIRGQSTLNNNTPLILIDGIPAASFSHLSAQDIESLTVLKDGAAAIYGARAANGVILITTKRGKEGKVQVNLSSSMNYSTFSAMPKLMSSYQYATYQNEIASRKGESIPYTTDQIAKYKAGNDPQFPNTDWADLTFADYSPESRTSLSISGGSKKVNYFVGGDLIDQTGMFKSGDLKFRQYQVRSNIDIKILPNLKLGVDLSGRFGKRDQPGVDVNYIYKHIFVNLPTEPAYNPDGSVAWGGENGSNPVIMSSNKSGFANQTDNNLRSKFSLDWNINEYIKGLSVKAFAGVRRESNDIKSWYTPWTYHQYTPETKEYISSKGFSQSGNQKILRESFWKFNELMLDATIHYSRTFTDHTIRAFVGYEQYASDQREFWAEKKGFPSETHAELFAGSDDGQQSYGTSNEWARVNYFGMASYDYQKKYFLDFTLRHDGSSNFAPGKRFGTFPSIAASWSIGQEAFIQNIKWINVLKLRTSWALMGNDRIPNFQYLTRYDYSSEINVVYPNYYIFGTTGVRQNGYRSDNVPNPDITWEIADMKNIGLSFSMLDNKLSGDVNYFYQKREKILIGRNASIPDAAGLDLPDENLGKVNSFGIEFQLGWSDKIGNLGYNIGFNLTQAKNRVVYMDEAVDVPEYMKEEGHPMNSYIVYPTKGIFHNQEEIEAAPATLKGTVPGEPYYIDTNGDEKINAEDRVRKYYSNVPEIQYGITGGITYKGLNFNFLLQGQAQAKMLVYFESHGARPEFVFTERWTAENSGANYPRAFAAGDNSAGLSATPENFQGADLHLRDASFLRIKEVELGYTFPKKLIRFGTLKVFARGFNLHTMFSDVYKLGLDPEASGYVDFRRSRYPSLRTYTFGFNMSF